MGHFENQIEERRNAEQQLLEDSFVKIAGIVMGRKSAEKLSDERIITKNAIDEILKYYHYKPVDVPESIEKPSEQLKYCLRPYGLMSRTIELDEGWYKAEKGAVYYDGKDITGLDLPSLRQKIGTVMQDAGLFRGDIYSNIVISAPRLSLDDAWKAAEKAGIADDIRAMPMGMNTMISEGQGGISGGQRQRIMIARAIAPEPNHLIFDEATSALDNKTQRQVSEALDAMGCTRIVIAHRLSTIKHCDRILVLEGGQITEEGTYEELIAKEEFFAELVKRQRTDA